MMQNTKKGTTIETDRLVVRSFTPVDWKDLQEYVSLEKVTRYDHEYPSSDTDCKGITEFVSRSDGF